jgi:hypothetical protein
LLLSSREAARIQRVRVCACLCWSGQRDRWFADLGHGRNEGVAASAGVALALQLNFEGMRDSVLQPRRRRIARLHRAVVQEGRHEFGGEFRCGLRRGIA